MARHARLLAACLPVLAAAQVNYQPYPIGERASGMGGAYTALADDEAGAWYNPAGPAFSRGNSLSVSTSLYGAVLGSTPNLLGPGTNFSYGTINLIPSTAGSLWHLGKPAEDGTPSRWALALNVFAPATFQFEHRSDVGNGATNLWISIARKRLYAGPTLAVRINDRFSVGASIHGQLDTNTRHTSVLQRAEQIPGTINQFVSYAESIDLTNVGLGGALGVRVEPLDGWTLGLAVRSPSIPIFGTGSRYSQHTASVPAMSASGALAETVPVTARFVVPTRLALGTAYRVPNRWAASLDVSLHLPLTYVAATVDATGETFEERLNATVNVALGGELYLNDGYALRAGLFTDLSPYNTPVPGTIDDDDRADTFGMTLSFSMLSDRTSTSFGLVGTVSALQQQGVDLVSGSPQPFVASGVQFRAYVVFSSSFNY